MPDPEVRPARPGEASNPYAGMKTRAEVEEALKNVRIKLEYGLDAPIEKVRRYQAEVQAFRWVLGELGED